MGFLDEVFHDEFGHWRAADVAVANKKHFNHIKNPSCKGTICRDMPHFAQPVFRHILSKTIGRNGKSWQNEANRGRQT
jgi:hypothetical protein